VRVPDFSIVPRLPFSASGQGRNARGGSCPEGFGYQCVISRNGSNDVPTRVCVAAGKAPREGLEGTYSRMPSFRGDGGGKKQHRGSPARHAAVGGVGGDLCGRNPAARSARERMPTSWSVIGLNERRHRLKYALARTQSQKAAAPGGQRRAFYLIPANRGAVAKAGPRRRATTTGDLPLGLTPLLGN